MSVITELRKLLAEATTEPAQPGDIRSVADRIRRSLPGATLTLQRSVLYPRVERSPAYVIDVVPPIANVRVAAYKPGAMSGNVVGEITTNVVSTAWPSFKPVTTARFAVTSTGKIFSRRDPENRAPVDIYAFLKEWFQKLQNIDRLCRDGNFEKAAPAYSLLAKLRVNYVQEILDDLYRNVAVGADTGTKLQSYMDAATNAGLHRQPGNSYVFTESGDMRVPGLMLVFTGSAESPKAALSYNGKSERALDLNTMSESKLGSMIARVAKRVNSAEPNGVSTTRILATVEPVGTGFEDRMREYGLDPAKATIRNGIIVEYRGDVNLNGKDLAKIPFRFVKVTGYFWCSRNHLTSLAGCPREVGKDFWCGSNLLTSLAGCPREVGGSFVCDGNRLTSLAGCPEKVGRDFWCVGNPGSAGFERPAGVKGVFRK